MDVLLIVTVIVILILKVFAKANKTSDQQKTKPIFEEKKDKGFFETIFGELLDLEPQKVEIKKEDKPKKKVEIKKEIQQVEVVKENKETNIKEEEDFDLRKAVIYSEILNNPFIGKK
ncbi:MAG: hypothetical protein LBM25_02530 [Bacteroidales bacterium]|jgi:hypothetical protein|nr:hypothetical protein [Bacteroidales bacterium]